jgi:hypothetical protein
MSDLSASDDGYRQNDDEAKGTFVFIHTTHDFLSPSSSQILYDSERALTSIINFHMRLYKYFMQESSLQIKTAPASHVLYQMKTFQLSLHPDIAAQALAVQLWQTLLLQLFKNEWISQFFGQRFLDKLLPSNGQCKQ